MWQLGQDPELLHRHCWIYSIMQSSQVGESLMLEDR
jgi:hypothetical protein